MKKTAEFRMFVILLLCAALIGCGRQDAAPAAPAAAETEQETDSGRKDPKSAETQAIDTDKTETPAVDWNPDITFITVDTEGNEWTDRCFADAKLTMLNLWAYWCPPCVGEMPDLQKLYEKYEEDGFRILGVSMEEYEQDNILKMEELGVTYPTLRLTESIDKEMNTGYIPVTIFVNGEGRLVGDLYGGSRDYAQWDKIIQELMK